MGERIFSFDPVWRQDAKLLILGSMPSVESLKQGFYYAHPRNCFWPMMAEILGEEAPQTIGDKKSMLIRHRIALWDSAHSCEREGSLDSAHSCEREGSLDSAIRAPRANDFDSLYKNCPGIAYVFFNGAAAWQMYKKLVAKEDALRSFHRMPSTSPAYTLKYEEKLSLWRQALKEALSE